MAPLFSAMTHFARASLRLDSHHGSSSGMEWQAAKAGRAPSLSAWAKAQKFSDAVTEAAQSGKLDTSGIKHLKQLRSDARGETGALSNAQRRSIRPELFSVKCSKLVSPAPPGGAPGKRKVTADGADNNCAVLRWSWWPSGLDSGVGRLRRRRALGRVCLSTTMMRHEMPRERRILAAGGCVVLQLNSRIVARSSPSHTSQPAAHCPTPPPQACLALSSRDECTR